jgi:hypothetical protein
MLRALFVFFGIRCCALEYPRLSQIRMGWSRSKGFGTLAWTNHLRGSPETIWLVSRDVTDPYPDEVVLSTGLEW